MLWILCVGSALAGVTFGSYGRVQASADLSGGAGDAVNLVDYSTRLEKDPYLELDVLFDQEFSDRANFLVVVTPALSGGLFHYDGDWGADLALRNLYVEGRGFSRLPLSAWAGSRMLRGDDVHLLDFWPLDELNTVGGGLRATPGRWDLSAHSGLSRVTGDDWMVQRQALPKPGAVGSEEVLILDRQRSITSLKLSHMLQPGDVTIRVSGYGELHVLPEGTRLVEDFIEQPLPADQGTLVGAQLSAWGWAPDSFAHLWLKHSRGLGTVHELNLPGDLAPDYTTQGAQETLLALAGNQEFGRFGLMAGAYLRRVEDADRDRADVDDRWEANAALRASVYPSEYVSVGLEASHQWLRPDGLNPRTQTWNIPQATKLAIMPALQPRPGGFARPQIRLQYIATLMNDDARRWYADQDVRHDANLHHFVGVGAEWWLNSATYGLAGQPRATDPE